MVFLNYFSQFKKILVDNDSVYEEFKILTSYHKINKNFKHLTNNPDCDIPYIDIFYGPYESNRIIKHRPPKLKGLIKSLSAIPANVKAIPVNDLNLLEIVALGYSIYQFDIRYLSFNMNCLSDDICTRAVEKVQEALNRFYGKNNLILKDMLEIRSIQDSSIVTDIATIPTAPDLPYYESLDENVEKKTKRLQV